MRIGDITSIWGRVHRIHVERNHGGKPIAWDAVDRFTFTDGLIAERVSYFNSAPLMLKLVGRPRSWNRLARTAVGLFRR
jgi:hypothetical protein